MHSIELQFSLPFASFIRLAFPLLRTAKASNSLHLHFRPHILIIYRSVKIKLRVLGQRDIKILRLGWEGHREKGTLEVTMRRNIEVMIVSLLFVRGKVWRGSKQCNKRDIYARKAGSFSFLPAFILICLINWQFNQLCVLRAHYLMLHENVSLRG